LSKLISTRRLAAAFPAALYLYRAEEKSSSENRIQTLWRMCTVTGVFPFFDYELSTVQYRLQLWQSDGCAIPSQPKNCSPCVTVRDCPGTASISPIVTGPHSHPPGMYSHTPSTRRMEIQPYQRAEQGPIRTILRKQFYVTYRRMAGWSASSRKPCHPRITRLTTN
jgi:hypothetical protein